MKQILAIFRKDARHFWAEVFISVALQAALAVLYPRQWSHPGFGAVSYSFGGLFSSPDAFANLLMVLIPISWWILLARLVQDECLTGHTQFWITRPYRWPLLLGAKLLSAAVFVYLPFLAVQCLLLHAAGFHPLSYIPGLLFNLLLLTVTAVLPLMVLAALTSNIGRMTLVILGVLAYIAGLATLNGMLPRLASSPEIISGDVAVALLICGAVVVLLIQYGGRRTRTSWLLICALALVLGSTAFYDSDQPFMNGRYPAAPRNAVPPAQFAYGVHPMMQPLAHVDSQRGIVEVAIPFRVTGVAARSVVILTAVKVRLDGLGASHWESPWEAVSADRFLPAAYDTVLRFRMNRHTYDQFRTGPVTLHMSLAIDLARIARQSTIALPNSTFEVPGFAKCTPQTESDGEPLTIGLNCRSAMRPPDLTFITATWHDDCRAPNSSLQPGISGYGWAGSLDPPPAEFGLTSVWAVPMSLSNSWQYSNRSDEPRMHMRQLCPSTPLTFTTYALDRRTRMDLLIPDFHLPELSQGTPAELESQ